MEENNMDKFIMRAPRPRSQAKLQYNPKTLAISEKDMGGGTDQRLFKHLRKRTISQKRLAF
ncbi:MAG: hypothetical protein CMH08_12740 [Marinovum sp.]|jgi:hypothetical protein|nr:hypothetical protein [Marinovum sp.]